MSSSAQDWNATTAKVYDFFSPVTTYYARHALDLLREPIAAAGDSALILDNATGTGAFALQAAREFPNIKVLGTDVSEFQIAVAVRKAAELGLNNVEFKVMDGQALELEDNSIDAIVCEFGLMFFPDQAKGWSEMYRVLKPGSTAVLTTWIKPGIIPQLEEVHAEITGAAEVRELPSIAAVVSLRDTERLRAGAVSAGFSDVNVYPHEFLWKAWQKEETAAKVDVVMNVSLFAQAVPQGQEVKFKEMLTRALQALADENGTVTMPYKGVITVVRK